MKDNIFDLYVDYLLSSFGPVAATGLSAVPDGQISHDRITRMLSGEKKTSADLWHITKPFVRQIQTPEGLLIIDDSIAEKPSADENEIICWHYDHSQSRSVKGINFMTALYDSGNVSLPAGFQLMGKQNITPIRKTGK